jgi:hypothetical protein
MAVGLEWVVPAACVAAASAVITIALEDGLAGALPVTAVEITVVLPPLSVVAANHTAIEVLPDSIRGLELRFSSGYDN